MRTWNIKGGPALPPRNEPAAKAFQWVLVGTVAMNAAFGYSLIFGSGSRLAILATGFACVLFGASQRAASAARRARSIYATVAVIVLLAGILSFLRQHQIFSFQSIAFHLVAIGLFCAGAMLGLGWRSQVDNIGAPAACVISLITLPALFAFSRHAERISAITVSRDLGDVELNSVGVAFLVGVLGVSLLALIFFGKRGSLKLVWSCLLGFAFVAMLSTGTRGAVVYFCVVAVCIYVVALWQARARSFWSIEVVLIPALIALVLVIGVVIGERSLLGVRFQMLLVRMQELLLHFTDSGVIDPSSYERSVTIGHYLETWQSWILFGQFGYVGYPHNQLLEWLVRFGLLGGLLAAGSLFLAARVPVLVFQLRRRIDLELAFMGSLFAFSYLQSLSSLSLEYNRPLFLSAGFFVGLMNNSIVQLPFRSIGDMKLIAARQIRLSNDGGHRRRPHLRTGA